MASSFRLEWDGEPGLLARFVRLWAAFGRAGAFDLTIGPERYNLFRLASLQYRADAGQTAEAQAGDDRHHS